MRIYLEHLILVVFCLWLGRSYGLEKDLEVSCLDGHASDITEGGVLADCSYQGLTRTSTIGTWLFELANVLQGVNASYNKIRKVGTFPVLPRVLTLTLHHNSISEIEPRAFSGLENLQNLDLSNNRISGNTLKDVLVGRPTKGTEKYGSMPIRMLFLSYNNITKLEPEVFQHLEYLRDLHLDYNKELVIDENFMLAMQKLPELKILNLAGTGLKTLPKKAFKGVSLMSLLLNGNEFTRVPELNSLGSTLRLININQNPIEELDQTSFSGLDSLMEIVVSGMPKLKAIRSGTFSAIEHLKTISCSYNPELVYIDEDAFWEHSGEKRRRSNLKEVYLNDNALPLVGKHLLPWLTLKKITLDGNHWVCDCRLHWLNKLLNGRTGPIERLTELKCWEPTWLNGTQIVFWKIDTESRHENFPCEAEIKQEQLEAGKKRKLLEETVLKKIEEERVKSIPMPSPDNPPEEGSIGLYYLLTIGGIIAVIILIVSIIAFNKYRNYRPIYHVDKMTNPMHNEMKHLNGTIAEKTQLVQ